MACFCGTKLLMKSGSDIPEWPGGWGSPPLISQQCNLIIDKDKCVAMSQMFTTVRNWMQRITPTTPAVHLKNLRDLTGAERKKKLKQVIYYSNTRDIEGYFPQKYFDYLLFWPLSSIWLCSQKTIRLSIGEKIILIMDKVNK